jgi:hypothetical protein
MDEIDGSRVQDNHLHLSAEALAQLRFEAEELTL